MYNVEDYLENCLISLLGQDLQDIELILINDGSSDRTAEIAKIFATRDRRVRYYSQKNAGLGAVRNRGVSLARGRYLTFVDSDDFIPLDAYKKMVSSLEKSGSDVAIGQLYRQRGDNYIYPKWSRELHARDRIGISLEEYPELLRDFYTPNKVYRVEFWKRHGFQFRENVLFEDQPVITQLLLAAQALDVLALRSYCWVIREDNSSLSSDLYEPSKVEARVEAARLTKEFLVQRAPEHVLRVWQSIQVSMYFPGYIRSVLRYHGIGTSVVRDLVRTCLSDSDLESLKGIDPAHYAMTSIALDKSISDSDMRKLLLSGVMSLELQPRVVQDDSLIFSGSNYGKFGDKFPQIEVPLSRVPYSAGILGVFVGVDSINIYGFTARKYVPEQTAKSVSATVFLVNSQGQRILAEVQPTVDFRINKILSDSVVDYSDTAWIASFSRAALAEATLGSWKLTVEISAQGGLTTIENLQNYAGALGPENSVFFVKDRLSAIIEWVENCLLSVELRNRRVVLESYSFADKVRRLSLSAPVRDVPPSQLMIYASDRVEAVELLSERINDRFHVSCSAPARVTGRLVLKYADGFEADVFASRNLGSSLYEPTLRIGGRGGVAFGVARARVSRCEMQHENLMFELSRALPANYTLGVYSDDFLQLARRTGSNTFEISIDEIREVVGRKYLVGVFRVNASSPSTIIDSTAYTVSNGLPLDFPLEGSIIRVQSSRRGIQLSVLRPAQAQTVSTFTSSVWKREPVELQRVLYLQCLNGSSATDSQLALRNELRKLDPSLTVVWGLLDSGQKVPEGDNKVYIGTREWTDALRTSTVVCVNHELPKWFERADGQVVLQTYHGHPFKMMGQMRWSRQGVCEEEIQDNLYRRRAWSHLLSPSICATELYKEAFPLDYEVLEFGAPRNDELHNDLDSLRDKVRAELALPDGAKTILYAPTWRDYAADSPWQSGIPRFIDWSRLIETLPDDVYVLFRGHPSQANDADREIWPDRVLDVTRHRSVNELIAAADIGVFDYSSIRFDYALTNRPTVIFAPDLHDYFESSPSMFGFEDSVAGPIISNEDELTRHLHELLLTNLSVDNSQYNAEFATWHDGKAGQRLAEWVLEHLES